MARAPDGDLDGVDGFEKLLCQFRSEAVTSLTSAAPRKKVLFDPCLSVSTTHSTTRPARRKSKAAKRKKQNRTAVEAVLEVAHGKTATRRADHADLLNYFYSY